MILNISVLMADDFALEDFAREVMVRMGAGGRGRRVAEVCKGREKLGVVEGKASALAERR